jgi:hypothetical protein
MSRPVRYAIGAVGIIGVALLYLVRGTDADLPVWALGLAVALVVVLSVAQDVALHFRGPGRG